VTGRQGLDVLSCRSEERPAEKTEPARQHGERLQRLLDTARASLDMDVAFVTSLDGTHQTLTYLSAEGQACGLELGGSVSQVDGFCHYMLAGELPNAVPDTRSNPITAGLLERNDAQIGSYVGVPVTLGNGRVYGAVCVSAFAAKKNLGAADVALMNFLARLVGEELAEEERRATATTLQQRQLEEWLAPGGLSIHAQPIVSLVSGEVLGLEALSRFAGHHGSPADVFDAAEAMGRRSELEVFAARSALELLPVVPDSWYLAINVSPSTVEDPRLQEMLFKGPGERIVLELTEHVAFDDCPRLPELLREFKAHGIRVAIDDAGSGYSGLQIILALAPDLIKLDIGIVKNVDRDPVRRALVRALTGFAAESGATILAEGIETQMELEALRDLGVTLGQGYHIARPAPLAELAAAP
jgi:EAL domain-containing protein (putative c-di-GMP-specific phosphodiesterase class I)